VASTAALAVLLQEGIGDTIRISLTPEPGGDRSREVVVAQEILQTMGLRAFTPMVVACPGCGRTSSTVFQELAASIQAYLRAQMPVWKTRYPGVENMHVAVMGCVVNGPGESRHADIGISLPGTGEVPSAPVYVDGERTVTLKGDHIAEEFQAIVENYVARRYGQEQGAEPPRRPGVVSRQTNRIHVRIQEGRRPERHEGCLAAGNGALGTARVHRARLAGQLRLPEPAHAGAGTHAPVRARHRRSHRHRRERNVFF